MSVNNKPVQYIDNSHGPGKEIKELRVTSLRLVCMESQPSFFNLQTINILFFKIKNCQLFV